MRRGKGATHFINVDLEVRSRHDLAELARGFGRAATELACVPFEGAYLMNLELTRQPRGPEAAIRSFVRLIHRLPAGARKLWRSASTRDFSIGIEAGTLASSFEIALTPAVLRLAVDVGARVTFVVYVHPRAARPAARNKTCL